MTFDDFVTSVLALSPPSVKVVAELKIQKTLVVKYSDCDGDFFKLRINPKGSYGQQIVMESDKDDLMVYLSQPFCHWLGMIATLIDSEEVQ